MSSPNETEKQLLQVSKKYDAALTDNSTSDLKATLSNDVVLHRDGLTLGSDLKGSDAVGKYFQAYFDKYDFKHTVIAGAVNSDHKIAFSFWQDQGVKAKGSGNGGEDTVGIWYHELNNDFKITNTWFLRQMTKDEVARKLKKSTEQKFPVDPSQWSKSSPPQDHGTDRCHTLDKASNVFNDIWKTGDTSAAKDIMAKDVKLYDPVFGVQTDGVEGFEKLVQGLHKGWNNEKNTARIACTHSDKSFIWWQSSGSSKSNKDDKDTLYGIDMILFNKDNKMQSVVTFCQPNKSEMEKLVQ